VSPSTEIIKTVEFKIDVQKKLGGLPDEEDLITDISVKIIEDKEIKFMDIFDSDGSYFVQWDLKLGVKAHLEILAQTCLPGYGPGEEHDEFKYLQDYQKILEITPDKNDKTLNIYFDNTAETKDLTQIQPVKVHGRVLNEFGNPVLAGVELSSEYEAIGSGSHSYKDKSYTDENGFFEMFVNPGDVTLFNVFGCYNSEETLNIFTDSDLNLGDIEICIPDYKACFLKANMNTCNGVPANGFLKIDYGRPNQFYLKVVDGKLNIPQIFFGTHQLEYEFYSPENASRSGMKVLNIDVFDRIIDLGNISLCESYESYYKLTINGVETVNKNLFIEKDMSSLVLNASDHFSIYLRNFDDLEWHTNTWQSNCHEYQTWLKKLGQSNSNVVTSFNDFELINGEKVEGSIEVEYYDDELNQTMNVKLDVSAPLTILN
jgi:hypothetical protein